MGILAVEFDEPLDRAADYILAPDTNPPAQRPDPANRDRFVLGNPQLVVGQDALEEMRDKVGLARLVGGPFRAARLHKNAVADPVRMASASPVGVCFNRCSALWECVAAHIHAGDSAQPRGHLSPSLQIRGPSRVSKYTGQPI